VCIQRCGNCLTVGRGDPQSGARYWEPRSMCDRWTGPNSRRVAERRAYVFFAGRTFGTCVAQEIECGARNPQVLSMRDCRKAQLPRTLNPLVLTCLWRLESSDRLPRTPGGGRERSTPLSRRRLGDRGAAWAVDCRERSAEAENALWFRRRFVCSRKRSGLSFTDSADRDAGRRVKWNLP